MPNVAHIVIEKDVGYGDIFQRILFLNEYKTLTSKCKVYINKSSFHSWVSSHVNEEYQVPLLNHIRSHYIDIFEMCDDIMNVPYHLPKSNITRLQMSDIDKLSTDTVIYTKGLNLGSFSSIMPNPIYNPIYSKYRKDIVKDNSLLVVHIRQGDITSFKDTYGNVYVCSEFKNMLDDETQYEAAFSYINTTTYKKIVIVSDMFKNARPSLIPDPDTTHWLENKDGLELLDEAGLEYTEKDFYKTLQQTIINNPDKTIKLVQNDSYQDIIDTIQYMSEADAIVSNRLASGYVWLSNYVYDTKVLTYKSQKKDVKTTIEKIYEESNTGIKCSQTITVDIGETRCNITREDAEDLYLKLGNMLGYK